MNSKALIIFVREPALGKVKTRLAAGIGEEKALQIYKMLLDHTRKISLDTDADRFVFYADKISPFDNWDKGFYKKLQEGTDLGSRMEQAFKTVMELGYEKALIIGSDCMELTTSHIETAFNLLDEQDVVIGPARDGGYYLLGMKELHTGLFKNKNWSTDQLIQQTLDTLEAQELKFKFIEVLTDIDTIEDLPDFLKYFLP